MVASLSLSTTFTGRVRSVNPKGLKLEDHEDWLNVSKFATDVVMPERGETVTVVVDGKGFVRAIQPHDGPAAAPSGATATLATGAPSAAPTSKDRTITRLAVLKAAAEFSASKPESKSGDVLLIAASWERWVLRDDEPEEDNVDAF